MSSIQSQTPSIPIGISAGPKEMKASTSTTTSANSKIKTKPTFVPIRPAFRPLLPKPCSSSAPSGWSSSEITISSRHRIDSTLPTTRKGRKSVSKDKKPVGNSKRRTKSATSESSIQLPSTISPSSLITKRKKSPSTGTSGLASLLASNNSSTSTSPTSLPSLLTNPLSTSLINPLSASLTSPISTPLTAPPQTFSRETSPTTISINTLDNSFNLNNANPRSLSGSPSARPLSTMLASVAPLTTVTASSTNTTAGGATGNTSSGNNASTNSSSNATTATSAIKMSTKSANVMLSSVMASTSDIWTTGTGTYPGTIPLWENSSEHDDNQETQSLGGVSDNDGSPLTASLSLMGDEGSTTELNNVSMYSPDLVLSLESYLTPEPDESEIPSYDPLEFLGPTINIF